MVKNLNATAANQRVRSSVSGFTLIELMVVVVVIGILAAIGYPAYTEHMLKSRRTDAKTALADVASRQQQYFADNKTYALNNGELGIAGISPKGYYTVTVQGQNGVPSGGGGTIYTSFTATAQPAPGSPQLGDTKCGSLVVNSAGKKTVTGSGTNCW